MLKLYLSILCFSLLSIIHFEVFAQFAYYPNGKPIIDTATKSIKQYLDKYAPRVPYHCRYIDTNGKNVMVYYKALTNKPLLVFTDNPKTIVSDLLNLKYTTYLKSVSFSSDVYSLKTDGLLTYQYLIENLGRPDEVVGDSLNGAITYYKANSMFFFSDGKLRDHYTCDYTLTKLKGLAILSFSVNGEGSFTGAEISFWNRSKKIIKYIHVTLQAYNSVDDLISTKTVKGVGPIEPNSNGSYNWEEIFYSNVVDYLQIGAIKIEFMDKSIVTLTKAEAKKIRIIGSDD